MLDADFHRLSAHVRARTLMSVCHEVWSEPADATPGVPVSVGMVEVAGRPYLVPHCHLSWLAAGMDLLCLAMVDDLGMMRMSGTVGAPLRSGQDPAVSRVLRDHRGCLIGAGPLDQIVLFPLELATISVVPPGGRRAPARPGGGPGRRARLAAGQPGGPGPPPAREPCGRAGRAVPDVRGGGSLRGHLGTAHPAGRPAGLLDRRRGHHLDIAFEPPVDRPAELWRQLSPARPADPHRH